MSTVIIKTTPIDLSYIDKNLNDAMEDVRRQCQSDIQQKIDTSLKNFLKGADQIHKKIFAEMEMMADASQKSWVIKTLSKNKYKKNIHNLFEEFDNLVEQTQEGMSMQGPYTKLTNAQSYIKAIQVPLPSDTIFSEKEQEAQYTTAVQLRRLTRDNQAMLDEMGKGSETIFQALEKTKQTSLSFKQHILDDNFFSQDIDYKKAMRISGEIGQGRKGNPDLKSSPATADFITSKNFHQFSQAADQELIWGSELKKKSHSFTSSFLDVEPRSNSVAREMAYAAKDSRVNEAPKLSAQNILASRSVKSEEQPKISQRDTNVNLAP